MNNEPKTYSVKYRAGYIEGEAVDGHAEFASIEQAQECFVEYFNQLSGDGGEALLKGIAWVKMFDPSGKCILNTAEQAARI